jgi:hypothetical protein
MVILWIVALLWLFFIVPLRAAEVRPLAVGADVIVVLGPILVVALCIEQILEAIFTLLENKWRSLVAYAGYGLYWLYNAETELQEARRLLSEVSNTARNIQVDLPTAAWLKEMKEQHKQGDVEANQGITLEKEPLLRIPEASLSNLRQTITQLFSEDELLSCLA